MDLLDSINNPLLRQLLAESATKERERRYPEVSPDQQQSIIDNALGGLMSGLQWVGESVDKFGRATRTALFNEQGEFDPSGFQFSDLLHAVPFSDTMGWTDPKDAVTPQAIRHNWGWESNTGNPWIDVPLNIAGDVAVGAMFDPLTLVVGPGRALTSKGVEAMTAGSRVAEGLSFTDEIARAAGSRVMGTSPAAMVDEIAQGERALFGLKLPFAEQPFATFGTGATASKVADAAYYNPISGAIRSVFDTRVRGTLNSTAQRAADTLFSNAQNEVAKIVDTSLALKARTADLSDEFNTVVTDFLNQNPEVAQQLTGGLPIDGMTGDTFVRAIAELKTNVPLGERMQQLAQGAASGDAMQALAHFDELAQVSRKMQDDAFSYYRSVGGDIDELGDVFSEHFHRRIGDELKPYMASGATLEKATDGVTGAIHRAIRNVEGGTFKVNAMTRDTDVTGWMADPMIASDDALRNARLQAAAQKIESHYGIQRTPQIDPKTGAQRVDDAGTPLFNDEPEEMARWLSKLPPETLQNGLFGRSFVTDMADYTLRVMRRAQGLDAAVKLLAESASEEVSLGRTVAEMLGQTGNVQRYHDGTRWRTRPERGDLHITDQGASRFKQLYAKRTGKQPDLDNLYVPEAFASAAMRLVDNFEKPQNLHPLLNAYDRALQLFKQSIYTPFPASHIRNAVSGLWQNSVTAFTNPVSGAKAVKEAYAAMRGGGNKEWLEAFKAYGLTEGSLLDELVGASKEVPQVGVGRTLSAAKDVVTGTLGDIGSVLNRHPLKSIGNLIGGERTPAIFQAGAKVGEVVEFLNRYSHFAALKARGWSNAAAARSVKLNHFDYNDLSSAERGFFKRLFPFYSFMRKNLPAQLRNLIDQPGGRTAQTIRGLNAGREQIRDKHGYTPSFLGEGLTIPLGEPNGPFQNFGIMRGLLPVEEAFNRVPFIGGSPDVKHTMENIGSMMTPAVAVPGQYLSQRQWWSHRPLGELFQEPFDDQNANFLLYSSPLSRAQGLVRTWQDPRKELAAKLLNSLLGGFRVSTTDVPKAMLIEAREILGRELEPLAGVGQGNYLYAKDATKLSQEQMEQLSVLQQVVSELQKINKSRAQK